MNDPTPGKRGKPFEPGNRLGRGRPVGSRNKTTIAVENLLDDTGEEITHKLIECAKKGQPWAIKAVMDRIAPARRERRVKLDLPEIRTQEDVATAIQIVVKAMSDGEISLDETQQTMGVLEAARKTIESLETANRLSQVETGLKELKELYGKRAA